MKICPNCRNQIQDEAIYCPVCGTVIDAAPQFVVQHSPDPTSDYDANYTQTPVYTAPVPYVDPYDHTAEFEAADIAEHKIFAMAMYLLGPLGIIIALMAAKESRYVAFHVRLSLKLTVAEILGILALAVLAFLMWNLRMRGFMFFVIVVTLIGLVAIHLLSVFYVAKNKCKETCIVRGLRFLK